MDGDPILTVHATAQAFLRAATNLDNMWLRQQIRCSGKLFDLWWFRKLHVETDL